MKRIQYKNPSYPPQTGFVHYVHRDDGAPNNSPAEMHIYPQILEREPDNSRGKSATVMYENGSLARLVEYAPNGDITSLSLFEYDEERSKIPQRKLVFGGGKVPVELVRAGPEVVSVRLPPFDFFNLYFIYFILILIIARSTLCICSRIRQIRKASYHQLSKDFPSKKGHHYSLVQIP